VHDHLAGVEAADDLGAERAAVEVDRGRGAGHREVRGEGVVAVGDGLGHRCLLGSLENRHEP
jgi:hypothetical protein